MAGSPDARYAEALLGVASRRDLIEEYADQLESVGEALAASPRTVMNISSPLTKKDIRERLIDEFSEEIGADKYFANFLKILAENRRLGRLRSILKEYLVLARDQYRLLSVIAETPEALSEEQTEHIKEYCRHKFNVDRVRVEVVLNKSLIGGLKLIAGNAVIDRSLRRQLHDMEEILKGQVV